MAANAALADLLRAPAAKAETSAPLAWLFDYNRQTAQGPIANIGEREQGWLDSVRKYDPNATWRYQDNSGSSNEGGSTAPGTWVMDFDHTKLPSPGGPPRKGYSGFNSQGSAFGIQSTDPEHFRGRLFNDQAQWDSPYGRITDSRNVNDASPLWDTIFRFAPMAIAGIGGIAGAGGLAGALGGGNPVFSAINSGLQAASRGSAGGAAGALAGLAGGALGLPSWANNIGRAAIAAALRDRNGGG